MKARRLFPLFARIRKSSKYFHQGTDEEGRARLFPVDGIAEDSDLYIYRFMSNRYRPEDVDLFTWTPRGRLVCLGGKAIAAKDRLILEFDAVSALLTEAERKQVEADLGASNPPRTTVAAFLVAASAVLESRGQAEPEEESILADGFAVESEVAA